MGFLDSLFGGGGSKTQTVTSKTELPEFQQPYLNYGLAEALRLYQGGGLPMMGGVPGTAAPQVPGVAPRPGNPGMPLTMGPQQPGQPPKAITNLLQFRPGGGGVDGRRDPLYAVPGQPGATYASDPALAAAGGMPGAAGGAAGAGAPAGTPIQSGIYQGPTVAGLSSATRGGINQIAANSGGIDPRSSVNALVSALNGNAFGLQDTAAGKNGGFGLGATANGSMLNANPYIDQVVNNTTRGITDSFRRTTAPGIESAAASRGRLGSGFDIMNRRQASESVAQQLGDTESNIRLSNYQSERGLQQGAQQFLSGQQQNAQQAMLQQRLQAAGLLPQVLDTANQSALRGGAALFGAGQYVDQNNTARMQDAAQRYERTMKEPQDRLRDYFSIVQGNFGNTSSESTPISRDVAGGVLGGAGVGANIGSKIFDSHGGNFGGLGALAGGVFGLLSDENTKTKRKKPSRGLVDALEDMPVDEWEYKPGMGDGGGRRHVGTMAQDFNRATGLGDGRTIPVVDAIGVTMGATKELAARMKRLERRAA